MRCKSALPRGRSECTHSHARGIVVNGAMTRPAPTRQEEATTSRLKGSGCGPRGSRRRTQTLTTHPFTHRREKPDRTGTHTLGACSRSDSLPELPPHTAPAPSPLRGREGLHDCSKNRRRLQTERAGEVTSQTACASSPCRSPHRGRIERQTVGELAAGVDVPRVGEGCHEAGGRGDRAGGGHTGVCSARGSVALKPWGFSQSMT